ncbi:hypothetical protein R3P38DRAFT_2787852 [Favolaschia claudopus]|uniref:Uncharacterized protein n=1 Tax=Favolaschia claudopus TaxID=2862362 RepID=A0AAW0AMX4_9AGAR
MPMYPPLLLKPPERAVKPRLIFGDSVRLYAAASLGVVVSILFAPAATWSDFLMTSPKVAAVQSIRTHRALSISALSPAPTTCQRYTLGLSQYDSSRANDVLIPSSPGTLMLLSFDLKEGRVLNPCRRAIGRQAVTGLLENEVADEEGSRADFETKEAENRMGMRQVLARYQVRLCRPSFLTLVQSPGAQARALRRSAADARLGRKANEVDNLGLQTLEENVGSVLSGDCPYRDGATKELAEIRDTASVAQVTWKLTNAPTSTRMSVGAYFVESRREDICWIRPRLAVWLRIYLEVLTPEILDALDDIRLTILKALSKRTQLSTHRAPTHSGACTVDSERGVYLSTGTDAYVPVTVARVLLATVLLSTSAASSIVSASTSRSPVTPPSRSHTWASARRPRALQVSLPQLYDSSICHTHAAYSVRSDTLPDRYPTAALPYGRKQPVSIFIHPRRIFIRNRRAVRCSLAHSSEGAPWLAGRNTIIRGCAYPGEVDPFYFATVRHHWRRRGYAQALASGTPSPPSSFPPCTNPVCVFRSWGQWRYFASPTCCAGSSSAPFISLDSAPAMESSILSTPDTLLFFKLELASMLYGATLEGWRCPSTSWFSSCAGIVNISSRWPGGFSYEACILLRPTSLVCAMDCLFMDYVGGVEVVAFLGDVEYTSISTFSTCEAATRF